MEIYIQLRYHGLYGSTSCCISQWPKYPAIKNDVDGTVDGYDVLHMHRPATVGRPSGGGLAFIYRDNFVVKPHPVSTTLAPSTFELQLLRVTSTRPPLTIVNVYRPPATSLSTFSDELADTLSAVSAATTDRLLLCGRCCS